MKVGVTGAAGLLGSSIIRHLMRVPGITIKALARRRLPVECGTVEFMLGDLERPSDCASFVHDLDAILHFAHTNSPLTSETDWTRDTELNLLPTLNLLTAIAHAGRRPHVVFPSSGGAVYGVVRERTPFREDQSCQPENSYGIQKLTAEHYLRIMAERDMLSAVTLRIGNAYGWILAPDRLQGFVGTAVHRVLHGLPIRILGDPENVRDYVHVDDVCDALLRALEMRTRYEVFNIGTGVGTSVTRILRMLEDLSGHALTVRVEHMPGAERLPPWCVLDCTRAATQLGWRARIPLAHGLRQMLDAARAAA